LSGLFKPKAQLVVQEEAVATSEEDWGDFGASE
jgi:hypothetical protein